MDGGLKHGNIWEVGYEATAHPILGAAFVLKLVAFKSAQRLRAHPVRSRRETCVAEARHFLGVLCGAGALGVALSPNCQIPSLKPPKAT